MAMKLYDRWVGKYKYEVYRYFVTANMDRRIKFIRKYFKIMDKIDIPTKFKRRKTFLEYAEAAVMILGRIDQFLSIDAPISIGSAYLDKKAWAVFGEGNFSSVLTFRNFEDLASHYLKIMLSKQTHTEDFHFRVSGGLIEHLSDKYYKPTHLIMLVAISLLYDILVYGGPDCPIISDLFTNDLRKSKVNIKEWEVTRCKVMGHYGRISDTPFLWEPGQIITDIPMISSIGIEALPEKDDISKGEKVRWVEYSDPHREEDSYDDQTLPPELDADYQGRVRDVAKKYAYLSMGSWCD